MKKSLSTLVVASLIVTSFSWVFAADSKAADSWARTAAESAPKATSKDATSTAWDKTLASWDKAPAAAAKSSWDKTTAAAWKVDHFEVSTAPSSAKAWEAIDITIKAVDKDWNVKKDYSWTIYITVDNDSKATIPYSDWYQFVASDLWQKTFSKWLSFTKEWKMKVIVMDIDNDSLEWSVEVEVWAWGGPATTWPKWDITITSPDNGMTIAWDKLTVSGTSKKNSKIKFFLNGNELKDLEWQTDEKGWFNVELKGLSQAQNILQVKILDWSDKIVAESDKINFSIDSSWPSVKSFKILEWTQAPAWAQVTAVLVSEPWLTEVTASIADAAQPLVEDTANPGTYSGSLTLPAAPGDYAIDLSMKNNLWKSTSKKAYTTIKAIESNIFKNVKAELWDKKVTFTFEVSPDKPEYAKFKFVYGTDSETLKTAWDTQNKESVTFEKAKLASGSGTYKWYIPWLDPAWKYFFKIKPIGADWKEISWIESDVIEADFSMYSASKCMISNVSWLKVKKAWDVSELTWDSLPEAKSYNVYKLWTDWKYTLIENVPTNKYTVNISWDKLKYDDFTIKAVCWEWDSKAESKDYSNATKVQTWPAQIAFFIGISMIAGYFLVRRKYIS